MTSLLIFITALLFVGQEPSLKPVTPQRRTEPPTLLSLEVKYNATLPPAYISVRGPSTKLARDSNAVVLQSNKL